MNRKLSIATSAMNRLMNFMDEVETPSPAQADAMAAILQSQQEMRGMLAELRSKPRVKSVRMERGEDGRPTRAVPEYEQLGAQIDAALASPTPDMPAAPAIGDALVAEGLGLAPPY